MMQEFERLFSVVKKLSFIQKITERKNRGKLKILIVKLT